jgi:hypothetical protein
MYSLEPISQARHIRMYAREILAELKLEREEQFKSTGRKRAPCTIERKCMRQIQKEEEEMERVELEPAAQQKTQEAKRRRINPIIVSDED